MWICDTPVKVELTPGFLLVLSGLFFLDRGTGLLFPALLSCALHEGGHILAGATAGGRVQRLTLSAVGAELELNYPKVLSYGEENLIALAGPGVNVLAGAIAMWFGQHLFGLICLGIGGFNLLPLLPLDGGRVLLNLLNCRCDPPWPERITMITTAVVAGVLLGIGGIAAVEYANWTLLLTSGWILLKTLNIQGEKRK